MADTGNETRDASGVFDMDRVHDGVWAALIQWKPHFGQGQLSGGRVSIRRNDAQVSEIYGTVPTSMTIGELIGLIIDGTANGKQGFRATFSVQEFNDRASALEGSHTSDTDKQTAKQIRAYLVKYGSKLPQ